MGTAYKDGHRYDAIVVGSGMGGAVVARELARAGRDILVVEAGKPETKIGTFKESLRYFDTTGVRTPTTSAEGTILWRTLMAGGSTVVSCGNGTRCLERELAELGVDISEELDAMEAEMGIVPIAEEHLSDMGLRIREGARELGYTFDLMPKCVDQEICNGCGNCTFGCSKQAKWTAERPLADAVEHGAEVAYGVGVDRVSRSNGHVTGIVGHGPDGEFEARADTVVLAAGGFGTAPILLNSGVEAAGEHLFIDLLVNVYAATDEKLQTVEPQMSLVDTELHEERGYLLSPFLAYSKPLRTVEAGPVAGSRSARRSIGMMVKTVDDPAGRIYSDGTVSKPVTRADQKRFDDGAAVAEDILVAAGAKRGSAVVSRPSGAHPGGTAAIGEIVDSDLATEIDGLFVADGSVLPTAPGMPPMMTIGALARRLGRKLAA